MFRSTRKKKKKHLKAIAVEKGKLESPLKSNKWQLLLYETESSATLDYIYFLFSLKDIIRDRSETRPNERKNFLPRDTNKTDKQKIERLILLIGTDGGGVEQIRKQFLHSFCRRSKNRA